VCSTAVKNEQPKDEYEHIQDDNLQEYEQHVCDNTKPPKISAAVAFLTEVGGRVLVELITLREALRRYLASLKVVINQWLGRTNTQ
jgi:hypothetical protein